jgi:hypothetical protein
VGLNCLAGRCARRATCCTVGGEPSGGKWWRRKGMSKWGMRPIFFVDALACMVLQGRGDATALGERGVGLMWGGGSDRKTRVIAPPLLCSRDTARTRGYYDAGGQRFAQNRRIFECDRIGQRGLRDGEPIASNVPGLPRRAEVPACHLFPAPSMQQLPSGTSSRSAQVVEMVGPGHFHLESLHGGSGWWTAVGHPGANSCIEGQLRCCVEPRRRCCRLVVAELLRV